MRYADLTFNASTACRRVTRSATWIVAMAALGASSLAVAGLSSPAAAAPAAQPEAASPCGPSPFTPDFMGPWNASTGGVSVGATVVELTSGCHFGTNETTGYMTASVVKLQIMGSVLLALQDQGAQVDSNLDYYLTNMIEHSDNDAADYLYNWLGGGDGLQAYGERLGLTATDNAWAPGAWGDTVTTTADQAGLIGRLLVAGGPLTPASRAIARQYLQQVQSDQAWGVGSVSGPGLHSLVKNGWLDNSTNTSTSDVGWRLTTVGLVEDDDGRSWAISIMGNNWSSFDQTALIDQLAQHIVAVVQQRQVLAKSAPLTPGPVTSTLQAMAPARLLDTRSSGGPIAAGAVRTVDVRQNGKVPAAVGVNVTAVNPADTGFLTVFPTGSARPNTSNLNTTPGRTAANFAVTNVGLDGTISVYTSGRSDVIIDLLDVWNPASGPVSAGRFVPAAPTRVLDTRSGPWVAGGQTVNVPLLGQAGIPATASAVALTVTVTQAVGDGYWTVWGAGVLPNSSNINVRAGDTLANTTIATPDASGNVHIYTQSGGHVIVDVVGWFTGTADPAATAGLFSPLASPVRIADTRSELDATEMSPTPVAIPVGAAGFIGNLTWLNPRIAGYVTAWPAGAPKPNASVANPDPSLASALANAVVLGTGAGDAIDLASSDQAGFILDVAGLFTR